MTGVDLDPTISTYLVLGEDGTRQKEVLAIWIWQKEKATFFGGHWAVASPAYFLLEM